MTTDLETLATSIRRVADRASRGLVDRRALVESTLLAAVAQEHVLVVGPPGTAKSQAVRQIAEAVGERYFEYLISKFTEPSEIFGALDLAELRAGRVVVDTTDMLPEAQLAFLDEVFLGSSAILNTLLDPQPERGRPKLGRLCGMISGQVFPPERVTEAAAANNAHWCDLVCRSHGLDPTFRADAWTSRTRTPLRYPDAVTLAPDVSPTALLTRIDVSEGCSIKDSFTSLDLTDHGFRVLFEAEWIVRIPGAIQPVEVPQRWAVVSDAGEFGIWEEAWRGEEGPSGVLLVELLDHDSVNVLAAYAEDRLVAGAVLNRTPEVVGISNFFAEPGFASTAWDGCVGFATMLFPGSTLVGYQTGGASQRALGFESAGPLRVWLHQG